MPQAFAAWLQLESYWVYNNGAKYITNCSCAARKTIHSRHDLL